MTPNTNHVLEDKMNRYPKINTLFLRDDKHRLTEQIRRPVIGSISKWLVTEKIDGTNIRIHYELDEEGNITGRIGGRTDRAQIPAGIIEYIYNLHLDDSVREIMKEHELTQMTLFGEGYGSGIQKGGGDYRDKPGFILFDIQVGDHWLTDEVVTQTANELAINRVPFLGEMKLEDIIELVQRGFESQCAAKPKKAEGVVGRPLEPLYDSRGSRVILKLKTKDFERLSPGCWGEP